MGLTIPERAGTIEDFPSQCARNSARRHLNEVEDIVPDILIRMQPSLHFRWLLISSTFPKLEILPLLVVIVVHSGKILHP